MVRGELARPGGVALVDEAASLRVEVAEEGLSGATGEEGGGERSEVLSGRGLSEEVLSLDEQQQEDGGASLEGQRAELAQSVDGEVEITGGSRGRRRVAFA